MTNPQFILTFDLSLPEVLFVILFTLKLCGVIACSWWWVCSPILILVGLGGIIFFGKKIFKKKNC